MASEKNIIFIGRKPVSVYSTSLVMLSGNNDNIIIKARGRNISIAVDVCQLTLRRFLKDWEVTNVKLGTSEMETEDKKQIFVSTIEIQISKIK